MSKLLYAWEFGANLGHIGAFLPLARALRQRGHDVLWAVAQTAPAARVLAQDGFTWLQAPTCQELPRAGPPLSYNDILLRFGYANGEDLLGLVVAWRELLRLTGAQAALADHAPTAILAARTLGIPVVLFGSGFQVPPRQRPLPNMRPWLALQPGQLDALESEALASINAILERFDQPPFDAVAQLFDVAEDTLLGFPELDHYSERGPARYWGNLPDAGVGKVPAWPALQGKRIFGYLRTGTRHHEAALAALHALGEPSVVFFPDAPPALIERYAAPHLVFSASPLDLAQTAREADAAVTYASMSTATSFLLKGKPLLLLPGHLEQFLLARRVEEMGAGLIVNPEQPPVDVELRLHRVLFEVDFTLNAQAFARKYSNFPQVTVIAHLIDRIEEIAAAQAPAGASQ
jgi:UDP:flavonoid glycosyltransferase YjiC (YdhE family)